MSKVEQITVKLGAGGTTASLLDALARGGVRLRALQAEGSTARMVVDEPGRALGALREAGIEGWSGEALEVDLSSEPRDLDALVGKLREAGIRIDAAYAGPGEGPGRMRTILAVSDLERALELVRGR